MKHGRKVGTSWEKMNMPHCLVKLCSQPTTRVTQYLKPWGTTKCSTSYELKQRNAAKQANMFDMLFFPFLLVFSLSLCGCLCNILLPWLPKASSHKQHWTWTLPLSFRLALQLISNTSIPWGPALAEMAFKIPHWDFFVSKLWVTEKSRWFSNLYYGVNGLWKLDVLALLRIFALFKVDTGFTYTHYYI